MQAVVIVVVCLILLGLLVSSILGLLWSLLIHLALLCGVFFIIGLIVIPSWRKELLKDLDEDDPPTEVKSKRPPD